MNGNGLAETVTIAVAVIGILQISGIAVIGYLVQRVNYLTGRVDKLAWEVASMAGKKKKGGASA